MAKVGIIGSGFAGLSAAAYLGRAGCEVHVFEKNNETGGRARQLRTESGYVFDMGPSWYWMPDIFDRFFADFGIDTNDMYRLTRLDPAFEVVFPGQVVRVPDSYEALVEMFEGIETGSGERLTRFLNDARYKYEKAVSGLIYQPGLSVKEYLDPGLITDVLRLQIFSSFSKHIKRFFRDPKLLAIMEFPVLFLGAKPTDTPALYSLMNYAGLCLGTWYPDGGFGSVIRSVQSVAEKNGVKIHTNSPVDEIVVEAGDVGGLKVNGRFNEFDAVIAACDYHHTESQLLPAEYRNYKTSYWDKKVLAPSCLIFFIGISKKVPGIKHHTLFFDEDFSAHAEQIYTVPSWPEKPLFYVCCPSKTDAAVAPQGHENLFLLMPVAAGLTDTPDLREKYYHTLMDRLERHAGEELRLHVDFKQSYCVKDFVEDYHSYKGNAYGLANTLMQTAIFKPSVSNKHLNNLFYAGHLTVPGPGVPPALISGKIAAEQVLATKKTHV